MTQGNKQEKDKLTPEINSQDKDNKLASGLERLAFRLHDLANRLMGYLR